MGRSRALEALSLVVHVFFYHTLIWYLLGTKHWEYKDNSDMVGPCP